MMRWINWVLGVSLTLGMAGCAQRVFLSKEELDSCHHLIPASVEQGQPVAGANPLTGTVPTPADVNDPDRAPRYMTLQEAIALALENGTGTRASALGGNGLPDDTMAAFNGGSLNGQTDRIRVLAMKPAVAAAQLEQSLSRFDAMWVSSMSWTATDSLIQGLSSFNNGSGAEGKTGIIKAFADGGVASLSFENRYQHLSDPPTGAGFGVFNPFYTSFLRIGYERPLWRDAGVEINQLLNRVPGAGGGGGVPSDLAAAYGGRQNALSQGNGLTEGILIARLRLDQQKSEFERTLNNLLLNVEIAYWRLYQAYGRLYSFEENMRLAHKAWQTGEARFKAGIIGPANFHPIRGQYEEFRGLRVESLGDVLDKERNLRRILGLSIEDGTRIIPITPPVLAPFAPDWQSARQEALLKRPELALTRDNLRFAQYNLIAQKNFLKPDMRFFAQYAPVGFGTRLDGNDTLVDGKGVVRTNNAWRSLTDGDFEDWTVGLRFTMPLGFRLEHAAQRAARLELAQAYELLIEQEDKATSLLASQYQKLSEWQRLMEARRAERKAYADSVEARYRQFAAGTTEKGQTPVDFLLEAQRRMAGAQVREYEAIAEYNITLARFEWGKGTILPYNSVHIAEGNLPHSAEVRAIDHERQRSRALELCQRPDSIYCPGRHISRCEKEVLSSPAQTAPQKSMPSAEGDPAQPEAKEVEPQAKDEYVPTLPELPGAAPQVPAQPEPNVDPVSGFRIPTGVEPLQEPMLPLNPAVESTDLPKLPPLPKALPQLPGKPESKTDAPLPESPTETSPPKLPSDPAAEPSVLPKAPPLPKALPQLPGMSETKTDASPLPKSPTETSPPKLPMSPATPGPTVTPVNPPALPPPLNMPVITLPPASAWPLPAPTAPPQKN